MSNRSRVRQRVRERMKQPRYFCVSRELPTTARTVKFHHQEYYKDGLRQAAPYWVAVCDDGPKDGKEWDYIQVRENWQQWFLERGWLMRNCEQCTHKFICLAEPTAERLYEKT